MRNSKTLTVEEFDFLFIEKDAENIREIMLFCGIDEKDIPQELIYHEGGDPFCVSGYTDVYQVQGNYLVKQNDKITPVSAALFNTFFTCSQ